MNKTTEIRVRVGEKEIEKKLISIGAKKISRYLVKELIFDFEDLRITNKPALFRLRLIGNKVEIAYKGAKKQNTKFLDTEEIQSEIKGFDAVKHIIESLGLKVIREGEKVRTSFIIGDAKIEVDKCVTKHY